MYNYASDISIERSLFVELLSSTAAEFFSLNFLLFDDLFFLTLIFF